MDFLRTHNQLHAVDISVNPPLYKELEIGRSRMEDLRVMLDCEEASGCPEDLKPKTNQFDDLYFGAAGTRSSDGTSRYTIVSVEVTYGEFMQREIELIRNTNIVRITIEGSEYLTDVNEAPEDKLEIYATGRNTCYHYDNSICAQALSVRYLPQYSQTSPDLIQADLKIERLEWNQQPDPVKLVVRLKNGSIFYSGDLQTLLVQAKNGHGASIYQNQEDLDRIYVHPIRFVIEKDGGHNLCIKIFIHNWELVTLVPEI